MPKITDLDAKFEPIEPKTLVDLKGERIRALFLDDERIIVGDESRQVRILDRNSFKEIRNIKTKFIPEQIFRRSPWILIFVNGDILIYDEGKEALVDTLVNTKAPAGYGAFEVKGEQIWLLSAYGGLDGFEAKPPWTRFAHGGVSKRAGNVGLAVSKDAVWTGHGDGWVRVWKHNCKKFGKALRHPSVKKSVSGVALDGDSVLVTSYAGSLIRFDRESREERDVFLLKSGALTSIQVVGESVITTGWPQETIRLFDRESLNPDRICRLDDWGSGVAVQGEHFYIAVGAKIVEMKL